MEEVYLKSLVEQNTEIIRLLNQILFAILGSVRYVETPHPPTIPYEPYKPEPPYITY